jgi:hypothetical protein
MASEDDVYDPFQILAAPPPPPDVTPVQFSKDPITGFRTPDSSLSSTFAAQTRLFFGKKNAHFRHSYTALPSPKYIRVLIIRPGKSGDKLELDLMQVPFEHPYTNLHPYEALSYEWDAGPAVFPVILRDYTKRQLAERYPENENESRSRTYWKRTLFAVCREGRKMQKDARGEYIKVNGELVEGKDRFGTITLIQENLRNALEHIRDKKDPVRLWADAICINQPDNEEKMHQIAMMGQVYNRAINVRIWLGGKSDQSDVAMDYVLEIQKEKTWGKMIQSEDFEQQIKTKWPAIVELMRSRWFSRRWVLQEIALARKASVYCGDKKVTWTDFSSAIGMFMDRARPEKLDHYISRSGALGSAHGFASPEPLEEYSNKTQLTPEGLRTLKGSGANALVAAYAGIVDLDAKGVILRRKKTLDELISTLTPFDCGDPRDIIYAVLSIADQDPQDILRPNTNKSLLQVYTEFIQYCVEHLRSLDMICRFWAPKNTVIIKEVSKKDKRRFQSHLPSWIKCLEQSTYGTPDRIFVGQKEASSLVGPPSRPLYTSSNKREPNVIFGKKPSSDMAVVLCEEFDGTASVRGIRLGVIKELSARMLPGILQREALEIAGWKYSGIDQNLHIDNVPPELWHTLIAGKARAGDDPPPSYQIYCLRMLQQEDVHGDIHLDKIIPKFDAEDSISDFLHRVRDVCFNRKVFRAQGVSEELVGLCQKQSREDDIIAILYGCSVPVVLRPRRDKPVLGLDPACNNDPEETESLQVLGKSGAVEELSVSTVDRKNSVGDSSGVSTQREVKEVWSNQSLPDDSEVWLNQSPPDGSEIWSNQLPPDSSEDVIEASRAAPSSSWVPSQVPEPSADPMTNRLSRATTFTEGQHSASKARTLTATNGSADHTRYSQADSPTVPPAEMYYEVVGECYVFANMNGEKCRGDQSLSWEETFTLI